MSSSAPRHSFCPSFLDDVVRAMSANDFILLPVKAPLVGAVVALVCCTVLLGAPDLSCIPARLVPRGFAYTLLAVLIVSDSLSLVL